MTLAEPGAEPVDIIITTERYALTVQQAANLSGLSVDSLERARDRNELVFRYPNRKPVILPSDLRKWLDALPTEPPASR